VVTQGTQAVAIGGTAGNLSQGGQAVAIGYASGANTQGNQAVAIGYEAGQSDQGQYSIAIGSFAATSNQFSNSIVLNASGNPLQASNTTGFFVNPIREVPYPTMVVYDSNTSELTYSSEGRLSSLYLNMDPATAPFWDSSNPYIKGNDPEPSPLALDVFGSVRILKNLYIGSTTTVIGTAGIAAPQISTNSVLTSSLIMYDPTLNRLYPLHVGGNTLFFNESPVVIGGGNVILVSSQNLLNLVSTPNLLNLVSTASLNFPGFVSSPNLLNLVSSPNLLNLVSTASLNFPGFVSTLNLLNLVSTATLNAGGYLSTANLFQFVSTATLNAAGYVSTPNLLDLVSTSYLTSQLTSTTGGLTTSISTTFSTLIQGLPTNFGGEVLYLNNSVTVGSNKQLANTTTTATTNIIALNLASQTSNVFATFQSDFLLPAFIPNGLWDMSLWVEGTSVVRLYYWFDVYTLQGSTETLVVSGSNQPYELDVASTRTNITLTETVPFTTLTNVDAILVKVVGSNNNGTTETLRTYYEGSNYSHIHTTFGTILPASLLTSTVMGLGSAGYVSTAALRGIVSTPNLLNLVSTQTLQSTIFGLSNIAVTRIIAGSNITISPVGGTGDVTVNGASGGGGSSAAIPFISAITVSTGALFTSSMSSLVIVTSSLQVNSLTIGTGTGWVNLGPLQTVAISSLQANTGSLYATNIYSGTVSTVNAIQFNGLFGNYNNTVLAETSTGAGIQELLVFKGSSTSDRIRFQTTGTMLFETGVSARLWNSNTTTTLSNAAGAMFINTNSNVGIGCNSPGTALDINGTGRALIFSTINLYSATLNMSVVFI
jgi:hypothetical protein